MERPPFSFLLCPDTELCLREVKALLAHFPPPEGSWSTKTYWGDEPPAADFWDQFCVIGLFARYQAPIVKYAEKWSAKVWERLETMLFQASPYCWPFFILTVPWQAGRPKLPAALAKNRALQLAEKKGWVWRQKGLSEADIPGYLRKRVRERKLPIPEATLLTLASSLPPDALAIENELTKLGIFFSAKEESQPDTHKALGTFAEYEHDFDTFLCIRHIEAGQLDKVYADIRNQRDAAKIFFILITMLERDFRSLWQLKTGQKAALSPQIVGFKKEQAKQLSLPLLAKAMTVLTEAEWSVKNGTLQVHDALDTMLISLTGLFAKKLLP